MRPEPGDGTSSVALSDFQNHDRIALGDDIALPHRQLNHRDILKVTDIRHANFCQFHHVRRPHACQGGIGAASTPSVFAASLKSAASAPPARTDA